MEKANINLNLYRSFYLVAKYGGFTKASNEALISQSSLSTNIKKLEEILGITLFERNVSSVKLTKDGRSLYIKLEEIINILDDVPLKKEFNIGCLRFIGDNYLDKIIAKFYISNNDIKINILYEDTANLFQLLKKDELDLIICRYPLFYKFEDFITVEKIIDVNNVFVCSNNFYEKELLNKSDNYVYPLILPYSSEKRRIAEQYLFENEIKYIVSVELPNSNLLKKLILRDIGIGYVNKDFVLDEINNGEMIIVKELDNIPLDNISIIYNSKKNNKMTKEFIKIFKDVIKKNDN